MNNASQIYIYKKEENSKINQKQRKLTTLNLSVYILWNRLKRREMTGYIPLSPLQNVIMYKYIEEEASINL